MAGATAPARCCSVCTTTSISLQVTSDEPKHTWPPSLLTCSCTIPKHGRLSITGTAGRSELPKARIAHQWVCARTPNISHVTQPPSCLSGGSRFAPSICLIRYKLTSSGATETPAIWICGRKQQICSRLPKDDHRWVHFCCSHRYLGINLVAGDSEALSQLWVWQRMILVNTTVVCRRSLGCDKMWVIVDCGFHLVELRIERLLFHSSFVLWLFVLVRLKIPEGDREGGLNKFRLKIRRWVHPSTTEAFMNISMSCRGRCGTVLCSLYARHRSISTLSRGTSMFSQLTHLLKSHICIHIR